MTKAKLIINYDEELKETEVLEYVKEVIRLGKVSETNKGKQYCFVTQFADGVIVFADKIKTGNSFRVERKTPHTR